MKRWSDVFLETNGAILPIVVRVNVMNLYFYAHCGGGYYVSRHELIRGESITLIQYDDRYWALRGTTIGVLYLPSVSALFEYFDPIA